ncbi:thioredoxin domain-containing protein [Sphingomonas japonica]|uniref:Protein-disulfide isomerase n=1 Tax=Sphingomonas japonica TaxID=511662 RepID=A0ABX0U3G3_9SPHN|nr:thioredoxin domain-containing protein [Sphingomonas japonica]NIJ23312.1 protein-disulfide isomerase [Sphingomonas japonica]
MRTAFALAPLLALAACGGGDAASNSAAPAAPVAAVTPPAGQQWTDVVSKTAEGGFRMGNPDAPIKLVEFGSRTCHVCAEFDEQGLEPLKANYISTGKVSYEFRDYLRNGADLGAALLGACGGPGTFFPILDQMMRAQEGTLETLQALPESFYAQLEGLPPAQQTARYAEAAGYVDFIKQRGIPEPQARQCLADVAAAETLTKSTQSATEEYAIPGTPTFLINGSVVDNTVNWTQLEAALKRAGA